VPPFQGERAFRSIIRFLYFHNAKLICICRRVRYCILDLDLDIDINIDNEKCHPCPALIVKCTTVLGLPFAAHDESAELVQYR
jgi:hypothetical protein